MLVAFPIGLWVTSLILDLIGRGTDASYAAAGFYLIIGGCIGAALATLPGLIDYLKVVPPKSSASQRALIHGALNVAILVLFIVEAAHRGGPVQMPDNISLLLSVVGVIGLGISGWLGGTLVYRNQIAVDHLYANAGKYQERQVKSWDSPVCNQSELGDGQMLLATDGARRIVIGRCPEGIVAFSDQCTHRGGPLSDGALVGCAVQCPWHGSQFDVHTGRVIAGPAQKAITVYDVNIRNGEVYVGVPGEKPERKAA